MKPGDVFVVQLIGRGERPDHRDMVRREILGAVLGLLDAYPKTCNGDQRVLVADHPLDLVYHRLPLVFVAALVG
jgi:hypothetical protein